MAKKKGGLPKKYAKMGFKAGWKAYKAVLSKRAKVRITPGRKPGKSKSGVRTMAKKKGKGKKKYTNIGIMQVAGGLHAVRVTGVITGARLALAGEFEAAADHVADQAGDINNMISAATPPVIFGILKKIVGPVPLFKLGKYKLNLF